MTTRTSTRTVRFCYPFQLNGFEDVLPAGAYLVETDEEQIEGVSFVAYRRVLTLLHLRDAPNRPGIKQVLTVDPNDLDAALRRDAATEAVASA